MKASLRTAEADETTLGPPEGIPYTLQLEQHMEIIWIIET